MQVIRALEHRRYFCPLKDHALDNNRCDGASCMWWEYKSTEGEYPKPSLPIDLNYGMCGK